MINKELRESIATINENAVLFDNPEFDNSIIGMTFDGNVVYNYEKMVEELMHDDSISEEEAIEFIDYNTLRVIPYISIGDKPIVMREGI